MKDDKLKVVCFMCFIFGTVVPWGMLATGAAMSFAFDGAVIGLVSAWLILGGLVLMGASAALSHLLSRSSGRV
ncbi:hypothetical protein LY56_00279 [Roseinatronobacter thiooxidans]|uniref:Uncharacterized protein n=1 Tax=Roseinatronobacter thiooxidans TaxID=121821 RepID=A0A2W7QJ46_9RHOB|nr:hypothetical protein [Roseinatronobacter thiooxidans]PZX48131.1 hypothetical protein LY56_00279 [Roseinatronobacter thiooxidans]